MIPLDNASQHVNQVLALIQDKQFYDKNGKIDQLDLEKFFQAGNSLLAKAQAELETLNLLADDQDLPDSVR
jgi:hypothetical protein